jgi:hypothetical protein
MRIDRTIPQDFRQCLFFGNRSFGFLFNAISLFRIVDGGVISVIKWPASDDRAFKLPERRRYGKV